MTILPASARPLAAPRVSAWRQKPVIYEINTWVWLRQLSHKYQREISLATVPTPELDSLADWGFDAVWLMGVWHRGPATRRSALNYLHEYRGALPDISEADVPGSAFAIADYRVDARLGGRDGLAALRRRLAQRDIKLLLDFVPNHVATDHAWTRERPEFFIQGSAADLEKSPDDFLAPDGQTTVIARGRDPYFPAWIDTAQLNAFAPGLRRAWIETLIDIGRQCDGLRCDMAMLMMNDVFAATWGERAGAPPTLDFWSEVLPAVRAIHPRMLFIAEVYWGRERDLQAQGFDFTYDKSLYDQLIAGDIAAIEAGLRADPQQLGRSLRFIENHDEARAMTALGEARQRAAAALICSLPGAALLHLGQLSGRRVKLPVQISRAPDERGNPFLEAFYRQLLAEIRRDVYQNGHWRMLPTVPIHEGDSSHQHLIVTSWDDGDNRRLILVNLAGEWSRARIDLGHVASGSAEDWRLADAFGDGCRIRGSGESKSSQLLLEASPYAAQIFRLEAGDERR